MNLTNKQRELIYSNRRSVKNGLSSIDFREELSKPEIDIISDRFTVVIGVNIIKGNLYDAVNNFLCCAIGQLNDKINRKLLLRLGWEFYRQFNINNKTVNVEKALKIIDKIEEEAYFILTGERVNESNEHETIV